MSDSGYGIRHHRARVDPLWQPSGGVFFFFLVSADRSYHASFKITLCWFITNEQKNKCSVQLASVQMAIHSVKHCGRIRLASTRWGKVYSRIAQADSQLLTNREINRKTTFLCSCRSLCRCQLWIYSWLRKCNVAYTTYRPWSLTFDADKVLTSPRNRNLKKKSIACWQNRYGMVN